MAGKVLTRVRAGDSPFFLCIGDSILKNVRLDLAEICSLPGSSLQTVASIAKFVASWPKKGLILHVGTNDMTSKSGESLQNPAQVHIKHRTMKLITMLNN